MPTDVIRVHTLPPCIAITEHRLPWSPSGKQGSFFRRQIGKQGFIFTLQIQILCRQCQVGERIFSNAVTTPHGQIVIFAVFKSTSRTGILVAQCWSLTLNPCHSLASPAARRRRLPLSRTTSTDKRTSRFFLKDAHSLLLSGHVFAPNDRTLPQRPMQLANVLRKCSVLDLSSAASGQVQLRCDVTRGKTLCKPLLTYTVHGTWEGSPEAASDRSLCLFCIHPSTSPRKFYRSSSYIEFQIPPVVHEKRLHPAYIHHRHLIKRM